VPRQFLAERLTKFCLFAARRIGRPRGLLPQTQTPNAVDSLFCQSKLIHLAPAEQKLFSICIICSAERDFTPPPPLFPKVSLPRTNQSFFDFFFLDSLSFYLLESPSIYIETASAERKRKINFSPLSICASSSQH
jgi:hypothetical protein